MVHALFGHTEYIWTKMVKIHTYYNLKQLKTHTFRGCMYLYSLYRGDEGFATHPVSTTLLNLKDFAVSESALT